MIDGLVSAPSLNGCAAQIQGYDALSGRYMLDIQHGKGIKKFKRENSLTFDDLGGIDIDDSDTEYHEHIDIHGSSSSCSRSPLSGPRLH